MIDYKRYKSSKAYKQGIDDAVETLAVNLRLPISILNSGLFFESTGSYVGSLILMNDTLPEDTIKSLRKKFK